jgi:tetrapyrrole methylase family protein/MazG family protein
LFQVVFHACIEEEEKRFCMGDVIHDISYKMIHRHPHVFSTVQVKDSEEVLSNWEAIKTEEKQRNTLVDRLRAVPPMLPALMRASKVGKKAELFADRSCADILDMLSAQVEEMRLCEAPTAEQIGELLMTVTHLSRHAKVDAEEALSHHTDRIIDKIAEN